MTDRAVEQPKICPSTRFFTAIFTLYKKRYEFVHTISMKKSRKNKEIMVVVLDISDYVQKNEVYLGELRFAL